ncbi:MAG: ABC transporter ATP-binding protein [Ignavibacteriales bacterium]|nr:ABC transporter ATP-binding protein [Ignavibacteriales bacterium]
MGVEKEILLRAENIHKVFTVSEKEEQYVHVLKGISLEIHSGEIISIVGASGSGKSTLLHVLGTLDKPNRGNVFFNGKNIVELSDEELVQIRNKEIGFVFQFHYLLPEFSALENVMLPSLISKNTMKQAKERAALLLEEVGLQERLEHKPSELSGGEQQRVAVARALMNEPKIIFADEPTGNLDEENGEKLFQLFLRLNESFQQTIVFVTHNEKFSILGKRTLYLENGKIFFQKVV